MNKLAEEILMHYGMPRRSGRYPWGSGEDPYQHCVDFMSRVNGYRKQGMSEKDIAKAVGCENTSQLRIQYSLARNERRSYDVAKVKSMKGDGYSISQISKETGFKEGTVKSLLNKQSEINMNKAETTAEILRQAVKEKGMIDVSTGVEIELGVSKEKLSQALQILKAEGYPVYGGGIPQVTNKGKQINTSVLCPKGTQHKDIYDYSQVHSLRDYDKMIGQDEEGNDVIKKTFRYPASLDSSRLKIRYADEVGPDGHKGIEKDGVIELRRGVKDISLGDSNYAQVRIMVDGTHYLKGMAVYSDNLPDGVDVLFNTNKTSDKSMKEVLKPIKSDPDNPFGSLIKEKGGQSDWYDDEGNAHLSLINKRGDEGDWADWQEKLPSQFLAKQSMPLINKQLKLTIADKEDEYKDICSITNPTLKKQLLQDFADGCDSDAVHLKAAALPREKYQVILPVDSLSDGECFAPNFKNGETLALIRYPHSGTFEIPIVKVNNNNEEALKVFGSNPKDMIGINHNNADRLSGADFDGDTVMAVPCNSSNSSIKISSRALLPGLDGFATSEYGPEKEWKDDNGDLHCSRNGVEYKLMKNTQTEMGVVSNLIMDMTLKGANDKELARAVKYSMVVIDAEKHHLDYKTCYNECGIKELKRLYQGHLDEDGSYHEGASTLLTRAKNEYDVPKRIGAPRIDKETGQLKYKEAEVYTDDSGKLKARIANVDKDTGEVTYKDVTKKLVYTGKDGKEHVRMEKSSQMAETDDARNLISEADTPQERAYAEYANKMKAMANEARKELLSVKTIPYSPSARKVYKEAYDKLTAELAVAETNAPKEREAQRIANSEIQSKKLAYPEMTKKEQKKLSQQALSRARIRLGVKRAKFIFSDYEWDAIQSGAFTDSILARLFNYADKDALRQRATPKTTTTLSTPKQNKIAHMRNLGYTNEEIAEAVGCSVSTVNKYKSGTKEE